MSDDTNYDVKITVHHDDDHTRATAHLTRQLLVTTAGDITSVAGEDVSVR